MPFNQFNLHPHLVRAVQTLGFKAPTPIQTQAIPPALEGRDILGCAQTGSGKTVAFALPVLHQLLSKDGDGLRALILVPTRELAVQVEKTFKECSRYTSFKTAVVIGGVSHSQQTRAIQHGANIVVATPGRLLDHLRQGNFSLKYVEQLVLDEADRMLDMGFLPEIKEVINSLPKERQTQLFSATLHEDVERIAAFATRDPLRVEIARPSTVAEGISQILYPVIQSQKSGLLLLLLKNSEMRSVLVFTRTKHGADKVASRLKEEGYKVGTLHSNRSQNQRQQAMEDFRQMRTQILVATDLAARGIDVKNISHVVNFDVPRFPEDYVHRVGRTARAYGVGDAMLLVDPMEESFVKGIERFIQVTFPRATVPGFQYNKPPKPGSPHSAHFPPRNQGHRPGGHGPGGHRPGGQRPKGNGPDGQSKPFQDRPTGQGGDPQKRPNVGYAFRDRQRSNSGNSFAKKHDRPSGGFTNKWNRPSGGKPFGDKPPRSGGSGNSWSRPSGGKPFGDRPPRSGGSGNSWNRPSGGKPFGDRPPRSGGSGNSWNRPSGGKPFGDRPPRSGGSGNNWNRPSGGWSGNKPPRPGGGFGGKFKRSGGANSFGGKPKRPGPFRNKFKRD
jgi:ATP-dependent RNA helicase RhlE